MRRSRVAAEAAARPCRCRGDFTPVYGQTPSREFTRARSSRSDRLGTGRARARLDRPPARRQPLMWSPTPEKTMPEPNIETEFELCRSPHTARQARCCPEAIFRRDGVDGHVPMHDVRLTSPDAAGLPIDDDRDVARRYGPAPRIDYRAADQIADEGPGRPCTDRHPQTVIGFRHGPVLRAAPRTPGDEGHQDYDYRECGCAAHGGGEGDVGQRCLLPLKPA